MAAIGVTSSLPEKLRVAFSCLHAPESYRPPVFSPFEVLIGPDCPAPDAGQGPSTIKTPAGEYDIAKILAGSSSPRAFDLLVVETDGSRRNLPRNLAALACPKVLLLRDTHSADGALATTLHYALSERFDHVVVTQDRRHGHFFRAAGIERVAWIPGLARPLRFRQPVLPSTRKLCVVTPTGRLHARLRGLVSRLAEARLPISIVQADGEIAADVHASSDVILTCSINGEFDDRILEIIGSGGLVLTDALSPQAGMDLLFEPGRHLATFRSPEDIVEQVRRLLDRPDEAHAIRLAGQEHLLAECHPEQRLAQLYAAVFGGELCASFDLSLDRRAVSAGWRGIDALRRDLDAHDLIQSLHRTSVSVELLADPTQAGRLIEMVADLPHLALRPQEAPVDAMPPIAGGEGARKPEPVLVLGPADLRPPRLARLLAGFAGRNLVVLADGAAPPRDVAKTLAAWGFQDRTGSGTAYSCVDPAAFLDQSIKAAGAPPSEAKRDRLLDGLSTAEACLRVAELAGSAGDAAFAVAALRRAVRLDRGDAAAVSALAAALEAAGETAEAAIAAVERCRLPAPSADDVARERRLLATGRDLAPLRDHLAVVRPERTAAKADRRRILLITNLFPPQEMGGYGRKMWEFARELVRRGHELRVLTGDAGYLHKAGKHGDEDIEGLVARDLKLFGTWEGGRVNYLGATIHREAVFANIARINQEIGRFNPECCLVGNLDFIGAELLPNLLAKGMPVVHCIGAFMPGYPKEMMPKSPLYRAGPASEWVAESMRKQGYELTNYTVVYPGARTDIFYRHHLPQLDRPRIAYASLVLPYKGPHLLISALVALHRDGLDFHCTLAGDTTDPDFVSRLHEVCRSNGISDKVEFVGFLDRVGLSDLFLKSNIVVFPSIVEEAFGISQVEAMASGLAVVSSATGGGREIVRHGIDGLVFERNNADDLAVKLGSMIQDKVLWSRLSVAARNRALEFSVGKSVDRILEAFEEMRRNKR